MREIEMDFTNAFCGVGCCRDFGMDFNFIRQLKPKTIRILGLRAGEKSRVMTELAQGQRFGNDGNAMRKEIHVEFDNSDPWAEWRT